MNFLQRKGHWIAALGFATLALNALLSYHWGATHPEHAHGQAQYVGLWPTWLGVALSVVGVLGLFSSLAQRSKGIAALVAILIVGVPRVVTDPRCLTNVFSEHGCHTFLIAMSLVIIGSFLMVTARSE